MHTIIATDYTIGRAPNRNLDEAHTQLAIGGNPHWHFSGLYLSEKTDGPAKYALKHFHHCLSAEIAQSSTMRRACGIPPPSSFIRAYRRTSTESQTRFQESLSIGSIVIRNGGYCVSYCGNVEVALIGGEKIKKLSTKKGTLRSPVVLPHTPVLTEDDYLIVASKSFFRSLPEEILLRMCGPDQQAERLVQRLKAEVLHRAKVPTTFTLVSLQRIPR